MPRDTQFQVPEAPHGNTSSLPQILFQPAGNPGSRDHYRDTIEQPVPVGRLRAQGVAARRVSLPDAQDPNSFFVQGGDAHQFQRLLEAALP